MTRYESVLNQALELSEEDRELLMVRIGLSLEGLPRAEYDAVWAPEIKRRVAAVDSGEEELIGWDDAERMIFDD